MNDDELTDGWRKIAKGFGENTYVAPMRPTEKASEEEPAMNVPEKLAREISRVTAARCQYEKLRGTPGVNVEFAITMMTNALENAMKAAGVDDGITQLQALGELEGFKE